MKSLFALLLLLIAGRLSGQDTKEQALIKAKEPIVR